jgi:LCCL domain
VVNVAKIGCLLGNEFTFDAKANGDITFFPKLRPGAEGAVHTNIKEDPGAPGIIDQQLKIVASQQIRDCMKPYVQKLEELILGQASGNRITSIDASAALDLGDCPQWASSSLWANDPDRTYRCSCPAIKILDGARVTGTSVYELDDSYLCDAAIHAGALKRGEPGQILVRLVPAPPVFRSTTQNDIHSGLAATPNNKYGFVVSASQ